MTAGAAGLDQGDHMGSSGRRTALAAALLAGAVALAGCGSISFGRASQPSAAGPVPTSAPAPAPSPSSTTRSSSLPRRSLTNTK